MLNEKKLLELNDEQLGYINTTFENMTNKEKETIKSCMDIKTIKEAESFLSLKMKQLNSFNKLFKDNFNPFNVLELSAYERYYLFAEYHHFLMAIKTNNIIQGPHKLQLYAMDNYQDSYIANQKLIETLKDILYLIANIKKSKIGIFDSNIDDSKKTAAIKNSINNIIKYLDNQSIDNKEAKKLLKNFSGDAAYRHTDVLESITKHNLNYLNQNLDRYESFEQILLAPIKLNIFITENKYANKKNDFSNIEAVLKDAGRYNDDAKRRLENSTLNRNEFFKIQKNQIKQYCMTVYSELFNINIFDTKRLYTEFYSSAITSTNFLSSFYNHMPTKEVDGYYVINEFLPFLQEGFKEIIYEVAPDNIPEKEIIDFKLPIISELNNVFDIDVYQYIHLVAKEQDIPDDVLRYKL